MKRAIFILIFVLILLNVSAAETNDDIIEVGPYKQNSLIGIKVACTNSGGDCSAGALCNITVDYPNTTSLVFDQRMNQTNTFYNYTLPKLRTLGKYSMIIKCLDTNQNITKDYIFQITETGDNISPLFNYIITLFVKISIFIFVLLLSLWGVKSLRDKNKANKTPYLMVAFVRVVWGGLSYIIIFISPLIALFLFHPNFPIGILQTLTITTYWILFILLMIIIVLNIFWFSGTLLLKFGGLDPDARRTNKVLNDLSKFSSNFQGFKNKVANKVFKK